MTEITVLIPGEDNNTIDLTIDEHPKPKAMAMVAHPHPLMGGTPKNKVVSVITRTLIQHGYTVVRPSFRGVQQSTGSFDHGEAETQDILTVIRWMQNQWTHSLPLTIGGFSFGAFVATRVAHTLENNFQHLLLSGLPCARFKCLPVDRSRALVIHGEQDEIAPLSAVLEWARPQIQPIQLIPSASHFFDKKLHVFQELLHQYLG